MSHVFPPFEPEKPAHPEKTQPKKRRAIGFRGREVPIRILIPSMFTILALCAGLTAIRMAIELRFDVAIGTSRPWQRFIALISFVTLNVFPQRAKGW